MRLFFSFVGTECLEIQLSTQVGQKSAAVQNIGPPPENVRAHVIFLVVVF